MLKMLACSIVTLYSIFSFSDPRILYLSYCLLHDLRQSLLRSIKKDGSSVQVQLMNKTAHRSTRIHDLLIGL